MIILAIDTTELTAAAALTAGELPLARRRLTGTLTHSETMLPLIIELFEETGLTPGDVDLFACSAGPGSFTGIRIGVSLIKGLAFNRTGGDGLAVPCSGVSSLHALALNLGNRSTGSLADISNINAPDNFIACPVMDARRSRLYNALFSVSGNTITRLCPDRAISSVELAKELALKYRNRSVLLCGGGTEIALKAMSGMQNVSAAPDMLIHQSGISAAVCAYRDFLNTREYVRDAFSLAPFYLRPPQADRAD